MTENAENNANVKDVVNWRSWVATLRSGKYKQGSGRLRYEDENGKDCFCCLGVACDLVDNSRWKQSKSMVIEEDETKVFYSYVSDYQDLFESLFAPSSVWSKLGSSLLSQDDLAEMNDQGKTFSEIADYIESIMSWEKESNNV